MNESDTYLVVGGQIQNEACEINVASHCNLSCRGCSHLSPVLPRGFVDPQRVYRDLGVLARVYRAEHVRLVGGEPLLHPALEDVAKAILDSGVSDRIRILTNGSLLGRLSPAILNLVHEVHVSVYPGRAPTPEQLHSAEALARDHGVDVVVKYFDWFRESYSASGTSDPLLTQRIYATCQIAHIWRCHTVANGYFFRCPQSLFIPQVLGPGQVPSLFSDALELSDDSDLMARLLSFLQSPTPLAACGRCLGSVGKLFNHSQAPRSSWLSLQDYPSEDLVDEEYLHTLEDVDPDSNNLCVRTVP